MTEIGTKNSLPVLIETQKINQVELPEISGIGENIKGQYRIPVMSHPVDVAVGNRVRELRTRAGLSQTDLGNRLGVSFQQVQKYEKGVNRMGASRLIQICDALKVDIADIFDGIASVSDAAEKTLADPEAMRIARDIQRIDDENMRLALKHLIRTMTRQ